MTKNSPTLLTLTIDTGTTVKATTAWQWQTTATHHKAFDLCRSNEWRVQRLPFLTLEAISSAVLDLKHATQMHIYTV